MGRPKGIPKTGGRVKGRPNKATADVKALAQKYGPEAIEQLAAIMRAGESDAVRKSAADSLLDRAYGRAPQTVTATVETTKYVVEMPAPAKDADSWLASHRPH